MSQAFTFCPRCGAPLAEGHAFGRQRRLCRYCGYIQFHDPKVAVAALTSAEGRVLLVRRAAIPSIGLWALPAGYMDADELPEEALAREVREETGMQIRVERLLGIVPLGGWQERRGILLAYEATAIGGELAPADDVTEAAWFTPAEIPWSEIAFPSTADFLRDWMAMQGIQP
jgi:ADP-ribose pyrophosphatase YjhB (NUDIX family)